MTPTEERRSVARAQQGDKEAMSALWDDITPKLYGYLMNAARDRTVADDTLQNTWMKAIAALPTWRDRGVRFEAWLFAIARNELRQEWRRTSRHPSIDTEDERAQHIPTPTEGTDARLMVEQTLRKLSDEDREILRLRYIADLTYTDIARILRISAVAARVRIHRALSRARTHITH